MLRLTNLAIAIISLLGASCGAPQMPDNPNSGGGDGKGAGDGNSTSPGTSTGTTGGGTTGGAAAGSGNVTVAPVSDLGMETGFDLAGCGFDLSKPTGLVSTSRLNMQPIPFSVPVLLGVLPPKTVNVTSVMVLEESLTDMIQTEQSSASASGSTAELNAALARYSLGNQATLLNLAGRAKIGEQYPDWKGVFCSLQPATQVVRTTNAGKVTIQYSQPLPFAPMAVGKKDRDILEMKNKRTWSSVVAKVTSSTDPAATIGTSWTGTVTSESVPSSVTLSGGVQVISDLAIKLTYNFGGAEKTGLAGVPSSAIWYVDFTSGAVKLVQLDAGDGVVVNFLP